MFFGCESGDEISGSYDINAEIRGIEDSVNIYLQVVREGELAPLDTALLTDAKARFEGHLESPEMVYLQIGETRKLVNFFGENSQIDVSVHVDSLADATVEGSQVNDDLMAFKEAMVPIDERRQALNTAYREASISGNKERIEEIIAESEVIHTDQIDLIKGFLQAKRDSYIAPFIIKNYLVYELDYQGLDSALHQLDSVVHDSRDYIALSERATTLERVAVGKPAVDFTLNDPRGNPVSLSSLRGNYVLIDFWASWCGPCRKENPNVVALYREYKDKGFEILGVSLDETHDKWVKAIKDDALTWTHVSDLQGWSSEAGKLYGINSIPATVLLNKEGIIIDKNLRGDDLRKKLEEIYAEEAQNI
jgi:peroxiredoxin